MRTITPEHPRPVQHPLAKRVAKRMIKGIERHLHVLENDIAKLKRWVGVNNAVTH